MIDKYNEVGIETETGTLERISASKAKPAKECAYPKCEECDHYHGHWCTVPIVINKQNYILLKDKIDDLMKRVLTLEDLVFDELLKPKHSNRNAEEKANFTWADYFDKEQE